MLRMQSLVRSLVLWAHWRRSVSWLKVKSIFIHEEKCVCLCVSAMVKIFWGGSCRRTLAFEFREAPKRLIYAGPLRGFGCNNVVACRNAFSILVDLTLICPV